jgi:hypothetical protein
MSWLVEADWGQDEGVEVIGVFDKEADAVRCMVAEERAKVGRDWPALCCTEWIGRNEAQYVWWYTVTDQWGRVWLKLCEHGETTEWKIGQRARSREQSLRLGVSAEKGAVITMDMVSPDSG